MPVALGGIKMDYLLTEEQVMIRDLCRQIAREKIAPVALEYDKTEKFPHDIMKILSDIILNRGLLGVLHIFPRTIFLSNIKMLA